MTGRTSADELGTKLPPGFSVGALSGLLAPDRGEASVSGVGAKPWPGQGNRFVAVVCTGGTIPKTPSDDACTSLRRDGDAPLLAHVGIVELGSDGVPKLTAGPVTVDGMLSWRDDGLPDGPQDNNDPAGQGGAAKLAPTSFRSFDLAPYRIAPDQPAFGLRATWTDDYAGGMGQHGAVFLFAPVDGALRSVLAAPMSSFLMTAGEWHGDGTRDHDASEAENVIVTSSNMTDGHYDLVVRNASGPWKRTYRWIAARGGYAAVEHPATEGSK